MNYEINPCQASLVKQKSLGIGLIELNNTCYEVCNAFGNPKGCDKQCHDMVQDINIKRGYSACYPKRPLKPPIWVQTPHYFPDLLKQSGNIKKATSECLKMCKNNKLSAECQLNCLTDSSAIIQEPKQIKIQESYQQPNIASQKPDEEDTYKKYEKANPIPFYIGFLIIALLMSIIIGSFLMVLFFNK
jgi:hypothetical protein